MPRVHSATMVFLIRDCGVSRLGKGNPVCAVRKCSSTGLCADCPAQRFLLLKHHSFVRNNAATSSVN
jgi:hypothetical protein